MATTKTTQLLDSIMKHVLKETITKQYEQRSKFYKWMMAGEKEGVNALGTGLPIDVLPAAGHGFIGEGGLQPIAHAPENAKMRVKYTRYRISMMYTYDSLRHFQLGGDKGLLLDLKKELARYTAAANKYNNQMFFGSGTGEIAYVTSVGASPVITFGRTTATSTFGSRKIQVGGRYQFYTAAGVQHTGTTPGTVPVSICTAVDKVNATATFDAVPDNAVATDILVTESSWNKAWRGLKYHVSSASRIYQTLNTATYTDLKAIDIPAGGMAISVALFQQLESETEFRMDDEEGDMINLSQRGQNDNYKLLGYSAKRWDGAATKFDGSFKDAAFFDRPWVFDTDCDFDVIYRLTRKALKWYEFRPWGPIEDNGNFWQAVPGFSVATGAGSIREQVFADMGIDGDIGCEHPSSLAKISGLDFAGVARGELT